MTGGLPAGGNSDAESSPGVAIRATSMGATLQRLGRSMFDEPSPAWKFKGMKLEEGEEDGGEVPMDEDGWPTIEEENSGAEDCHYDKPVAPLCLMQPQNYSTSTVA
jgi:hypothetical protein